MRRTLCVVLNAGLPSISLPASAATVETVKGDVLINRDDGFGPTTSAARANAGDQLMAAAGGSAKLVYQAAAR
jgi:hypothetical protein